MNKEASASRWLISWIKEVKWAYLLASIFTLLSAGSFVAFSWYLTEFAAIWLGNNRIVTEKVIFAGGFLAGRYLFAHLASVINYKAGSDFVSVIKKKLYPLLLNDNREDSVASTLLITRISDDLKPFYALFIPHAISSILVALMVLSVSFALEIWVGFILLISIAVIPFLMMIIGIGATSLHKKHINLFVRYSAIFYNRIQTVAEIVNLDNLKSQYHFLSRKSKALNDATTNVMRVAILSSAVLELFVSIAIAGVAIFLGMSLLGIMQGSNYGKTYDFHIALFLLTITPYLFFYLRKFVSAYHDRNKALASAKLLMPIFEENMDSGALIHSDPLQSLHVEELSFAYPQSPAKVLHNIHLNMPAKGILLVKGISGSGKSTLLKILSGNLKMQEGSISINNNDNHWSLQWLKQNSSYMNQFPFIFDGTIAYNVFLEEKVKPETYPEFLNKILDKKEHGWETQLSHNGKQLSGGEKQLLTLARMMLHPKPVAILDEPTANLDTDAANVVLEQIKEMSKDKLVIIASHNKLFEAIASKVLTLNWGEQMNHA